MTTEATLRDLVEGHVARRPHAAAVTWIGGGLSWAELHGRALALAAGLRARGVAPGDVVAAQLPNGPDFLLAYLATGYAGAVFQTLHMPYRDGDAAALLRHGGAKAVICLERFKDYSPAEMMTRLAAEAPARPFVVSNLDDLASPAHDGAAETAVRPQPGPADPFALLYTSGTTSAPKGVLIPYARYVANAAWAAAELNLGPDDTLLCVAPWTHLYGLFTVNLGLASGATIATLPAWTPANLAAAMDAQGPTALFMAPPHAAAALAEGVFNAERLAPVRLAQLSGTRCPPELARRIQDLMPGGAVGQLWGMTELQAGAFTRPGDPEAVRLHSVGRASPGTRLRIAGDGELQVSGHSVFDGYLRASASEGPGSRDFTDDGWFRTGDLGRLDPDGSLHITGRLKEVINRGGIKFNPADVEAAIARHPAVSQCAVVPMPDEVLGERACCVFVGDESLDLETLKAWLAVEGVNKGHWPEALRRIDAMPMTPTNKVRKGELAALLRS